MYGGRSRVYKVIKTLHYLNLRINYKASLSRRCRGKGQGKTGDDILPFHASRLIQFLWKYLIHADGILKNAIYIQIRFIGPVLDLKNLFRYSEDRFCSSDREMHRAMFHRTDSSSTFSSLLPKDRPFFRYNCINVAFSLLLEPR